MHAFLTPLVLSSHGHGGIALDWGLRTIPLSVQGTKQGALLSLSLLIGARRTVYNALTHVLSSRRSAATV
jgi:hypothetical protein